MRRSVGPFPSREGSRQSYLHIYRLESMLHLHNRHLVARRGGMKETVSRIASQSWTKDTIQLNHLIVPAALVSLKSQFDLSWQVDCPGRWVSAPI